MQVARLSVFLVALLFSTASSKENVTTSVPTTTLAASKADKIPSSISDKIKSTSHERDYVYDAVPEESMSIRRVVTVPPGRFIVKPADNKMVVQYGDYLHVMNRPPDYNNPFFQMNQFDEGYYHRGMDKYRDRYHFRRKKKYPLQQMFGSYSEPQHKFMHMDHYDYKSYPHYGSHIGNVYTLTKEVKVPVIVPVEKEVHVPFKVLIDRPYPVKVIKPYPVPVQKEVPIPFKVPYPQPVPVIKKVPVPVTVPVDRPVPVPVPRPVPYYVTKKVKYPVIRHIPVQVKVPIEVPKPYPVYVSIKKNVPLTVEKPYYVPYKFKVDRPYPVGVPKHYPVVVEKPVPVAIEKPFSVPVQVPVPVSEPFPIPVEKHIPVYVPFKHGHHDHK